MSYFPEDLKTILDDDGHPLPITGVWCPICGLPSVYEVHPTCEEPLTDLA